jgi:tetratricopeptide (TPR) repeat protein
MHNDGSRANESGHSRPRATLRRAGVFAGFVAAVVGIVVYLRWPHPPIRTTPPASRAEAQREPTVEPPGYVGMEACVDCHSDRAAEFARTNHFRTFRRASPDTMPAGFAPGRATFVTPDRALRFEMTRAGNEFIQTAIRQSASGEERVATAIDLILGAGTADDVYVSWRGDGRMYELPMAWLHTSGQWGAANFDPYGAGDFSRELSPRCLECHNTWFHHVPGTVNQFQHEYALLGVTCERCHGPAQEHVSFHRRHPEADEGRDIVQPGRLTRDLQLDVCAQCHSNAMKNRGPAFSYRPGQPLESSFKTLKTKHTEEDHVANQIQYLRQSKCFRASESLTCTTCHDPHRGRGSSKSARPQNSCLNCHHAADCHEQDRLPSAVRDDCTGCHMPPYVKMNVTFTTKDDANLPPMLRSEHRIAVYPEARDKVLLDWYRTQDDDHFREEASRLSEMLVEHWIGQAEAFQSRHRLLAVIGAYREALRIDETPVIRSKLREAVALQARLDRDYARALHEIEKRQFPAAIETLKGVLQVKPNLAKAHGRLGTAYAASGENDLAVEHWQAVATHDPDDSYGEAMLGWLDYVDGRFESALEHFLRADDIEPYNAKINFHAGLALTALNRLGDAIERYERVIEIDPNHAEACHQLSWALCEEGLAEKAVPYAQRSAELTHELNLDALLGLARACFEAGQVPRARAAMLKALALAQVKSPERVPELRARLNEIQSGPMIEK